MGNIKNCTIITYANWKMFVELAEAIKYSLNELGIDAKITRTYNGENRDMFVVIKAFRNFWPDVLPDKSVKVLYQTEQLWNRRDKGVYDLSNKWDIVLELFKENTLIEKNTENVVYCPLGYSPAFEYNIEEKEDKNDILFWGSSERRTKIINNIKEMGYNIKVIQTFGSKRDDEIMKSKIILGIKGRDIYSYTPHRFLLSQCKKKFTLIEKCNSGYATYMNGLHFVQYESMDDLQRKLDYWLSHDKERKEFEENMYEDIKKYHNFTDYLKKGLGGVI